MIQACTRSRSTAEPTGVRVWSRQSVPGMGASRARAVRAGRDPCPTRTRSCIPPTGWSGSAVSGASPNSSAARMRFRSSSPTSREGREVPRGITRHEDDAPCIRHEHPIPRLPPCGLDVVELDLHHDDAAGFVDPPREVEARPAAHRTQGELRSGAAGHRLPKIGPESIIPAEKAALRPCIARSYRDPIGADDVDHRRARGRRDLSEPSVDPGDQGLARLTTRDCCDLRIRGQGQRKRGLLLHFRPSTRRPAAPGRPGPYGEGPSAPSARPPAQRAMPQREPESGRRPERGCDATARAIAVRFRRGEENSDSRASHQCDFPDGIWRLRAEFRIGAANGNLADKRNMSEINVLTKYFRSSQAGTRVAIPKPKRRPALFAGL